MVTYGCSLWPCSYFPERIYVLFSGKFMHVIVAYAAYPLTSENLIPHLRLQDVCMPEVNGIQLLHMVKQDDNLRSVPVISEF